MAKIKLVDGQYYFDAEDGSDAVVCPTWLETSKKNETHPDGKLWIKLPKGNITNRQYFSVDLFNAQVVDGEVNVEIKTSAPRVLGTTGVKQEIIKYLDEETAQEYTNLVNGAVEAYKTAKGNSKKKRPEDMTVEELEAYITAIKNGETIKVGKTGPKSFLEMFNEEEYARYNEILALAQENKANAPRAKRGPLTDEEKAVRAAKRKQSEISKAEKLLAALKAAQFGGNDVVEDGNDDEIDEDFE